MKQRTIKCCSWLLFWGAWLSLALTVLIAYYTNEIGEDDTVNLLLGSAFQQALATAGQTQEVNQDVKPIVVLGGIMVGITMFGILMSCCTKMTMHCVCVSTNMFVLLVLSITLMIFGAILVAPKYAGSQYVKRNCQLAFAGDYDKIDMYSRYLFEPIVEFDKQYQSGVNTQMCTQFCKCPFTNYKDTHYQQYRKLPPEQYFAFNRSFIPNTEDMVLEIYESILGNRNISTLSNPLIFQMLPDDAPADIKRQFSESVEQCYNNAQYIAEKLALVEGNYTAVKEEMMLLN